jgi:hypothetical protein
MIAIPVHEDITFQPPNWGGDIQTINAGGYLLMDPTNPIDIYGIGENEIWVTYADTEKPAVQVLTETLEKLGSEKTPEDVMRASFERNSEFSIDDKISDTPEVDTPAQGIAADNRNNKPVFDDEH